MNDHHNLVVLLYMLIIQVISNIFGTGEIRQLNRHEDLSRNFPAIWSVTYPRVYLPFRPFSTQVYFFSTCLWITCNVNSLHFGRTVLLRPNIEPLSKFIEKYSLGNRHWLSKTASISESVVKLVKFQKFSLCGTVPFFLKLISSYRIMQNIQRKLRGNCGY